jgi:hypothetical protein
MSGGETRHLIGTATAIAVGLVLAVALGWTVLAVGGHTDASGRMGLAIGAAIFALVATGWGRGRRGWLQGAASAALLGGAMLMHFWARLGRLP